MMRGVVLAGGLGSRLFPVTEVTNKHLLPVYDRPMIFHPLGTLLEAGVKDIMIVSSPDHAGAFLRLLRNGDQFGANFTFRVQSGHGGIAEALNLAQDFAQGENIAVILGDNVFEDNFAQEIKTFTGGARLFLKETPDAHRFGVAEIAENKLIAIEEKPKTPKSNYAITGLYLYDYQVFDFIKELEPSWRNELEITDVNNCYVQNGAADVVFVKGKWTDAGTFESLHRASVIAREKTLKHLDEHNKERLQRELKVDTEYCYPQFISQA